MSELAKGAKELYVYQRAPSSVDVRNNRPTHPEWFQKISQRPGWQDERRNNFVNLTTGGYEEVNLVNDVWTSLRESMPGGPAFDGKTDITDEDRKRLLLGDVMKMESLRTRSY